MKMAAPKITPCLWFDSQAEEAAKFYVSIFKNSKIGGSPATARGQEIHGRGRIGHDRGVRARGQKFVALNGGPHFKFNEAVSFQMHCETRRRSTTSGSKLSEGGEQSRCGWLKDKFGLSWQVVPTSLPRC